MTLGEIINLFREEAEDKAGDKLWSDVLLTAYANDAQMEACRRARLLVDSTGEVCQIVVTVGDGRVDLDPRVIFVRSVKLASNGHRLPRIHRDDLDNCFPFWETMPNGTPIAFCPNLDTGAIQLIPASDIEDTLNLTVVREPLCEMRSKTDDCPEIARRYHFSLVHWMIYRAYSKQDSQTNDPDKAAKGLAMFEQEFGKKSTAIEEEWIREQQGYGNDGLF